MSQGRGRTPTRAGLLAISGLALAAASWQACRPADAVGVLPVLVLLLGALFAGRRTDPASRVVLNGALLVQATVQVLCVGDLLPDRGVTGATWHLAVAVLSVATVTVAESTVASVLLVVLLRFADRPEVVHLGQWSRARATSGDAALLVPATWSTAWGRGPPRGRTALA